MLVWKLLAVDEFWNLGLFYVEKLSYILVLKCVCQADPSM